MTAEQTLGFLYRGCTEGAVEGTDPAAVEIACNTYLEQLQETYTDEQISAGGNGDDEDVLQAFTEILTSVFAEAGIPREEE